MFYYNARWKFALPTGASPVVPGGIIAASAVPHHTLIRRGFTRYPYLQHRLFDPQLYLAGLHRDRSPDTILKLSTYGWFPTPGVPAYDSAVHGRQMDWAQAFRNDVLAAWMQAPVYGDVAIRQAVRAAVQVQLDLGCAAVILPSPLTRTVNDYEEELTWLNAGVAICREMRVPVPVFATIAISDIVLRGRTPETQGFLQLVTDQVTAREVAGAYLVIEQGSETGYTCGDRDTLLSVLMIIDDIVRGAGRRVVLNYMGTFGAVAAAAGAEIWTSGYYLGQRALRLAQMEVNEDDERRAYPRYYSMNLAGDIGLQHDLDRIVAAGLGPAVFGNTNPARPLHQALMAGRRVADVGPWEHRVSNITAAAAHYVESARIVGGILDLHNAADRIDYVQNWLDDAVELADRLRGANIRGSANTELGHQRAWLESFERWRTHSGQ